MKIGINDYFELADKKYITLDEYVYNGEKYIFVNELDEEENPKELFKVFRCVGEGLVEEKKAEVLGVVYKVFEENFNKKLQQYVKLTNIED